ncbi:polyserase-2-like [Ochlerotatus camptorhynchus]|uniref:polyserase-2-like n=1 Tax=Ochlerotatus camptorhynchus TaxID=644619 RepID=UPI0031DD8766
MMLRVITMILLAVSVKAQGSDVDFDDKTCGRQMVPVEGLIKNGFKSRPGEWPWHVALFHRIANGANFDYQCGGTLVHKYLVVTAAHCVTLRSSRKRMAPGDILVKVGRFNISERYEEQGHDHEVDQIVAHRDYKPLTYENDIAILKLKVPVILTPYVQPVCLWKRDDGKVLPKFHGMLGTVVGWGLTENDTVASTLNKAQMPVVDIYDCLESDRSFFGHLLTARSYCAGFTNGTGVCNGDSGGGMYFEREGQWYLRGVVSFSSIVDLTRICNLKKYVGFTDAARYLQWIYENAPVIRSDDPILGHPNVRLINQGDCGKNEYMFGYQEEKKPVIQQYLWMAALRHPFQNNQYVPCNGVLINKNYILTSTCVDFNDDISVTLGDFNTGEVRDCHPRNDDPYFCLDPVQITTIAEYFKKDRLVLARLSIPAIIGRREHIQAICLPVSPEQRGRVYSKYTLTGWKESGQDSKLLQRAVVDLIYQKACREEMANVSYASEEEKNITDAIVCVRNREDPNRSPRCEDYQPGTAIQAIEKKSNRYLLYGIQTGISYCSKPERFIAVTEYLEWILDHMRP